MENMNQGYVLGPGESDRLLNRLLNSSVHPMILPVSHEGKTLKLKVLKSRNKGVTLTVEVDLCKKVENFGID